MARLFYKGEYQYDVVSPVMTEGEINGKIPAKWPQDWGRDAIIVTEQESGYKLHWVGVCYHLSGGELQFVSLYPTFDRHPWREMINLWFMLKPD